MLPQALLLAAAAGLALASPVRRREVPSTHRLHERHADHWSRHWSKRSKVPADDMLPMRIGLTQSNLEAGAQRLMDMSIPGSSHYGEHMTAAEVADFFAPAPSTVSVVQDWLVSHGIAAERIGQSANKQWLQFDATVAEAEDLLFAEFFVWEHDGTGAQDISTEAYHLPEQIREHVDYVTPGVRMRTRRVDKTRDLVAKKRSNVERPISFITELPGFPNPNSSTCSVYVTAECTRNQYSIPEASLAAEGNKIGIFESLDVHYSRADLDVYFSTLYPDIPNGTYPEERLIDGAIGAIEDTDTYVPIDLEAPLDFDSAWPLIYPQGLVLFQEDDEYYESTGSASGFWNTFLDAIDGSYCNYSAYGETGDCTEAACADAAYPDYHAGGYNGSLQCGVYEPTNVISISYGATEAGWPDYYMKRQCNEWMKLGLQGTTVVMSSGDSGVGDADGCLGADGTIFEPDFAASCPYVLAVGSTEWDRYANATGTEQPYEALQEVATARFYSGGGFSNIFDTPDYQKDAVDTYFATVGSALNVSGYNNTIVDADFSGVTSGVFRRSGRAYPDVAAVGDRQVVYSNGSWWLVGGTSLSSPVFAAVLNLINEERLADNKTTLGFIHPLLYQHPEAFHDITSGSNPGCLSTGFPAAVGWDPVTGLGSPNYPKLLDVLYNA